MSAPDAPDFWSRRKARVAAAERAEHETGAHADADAARARLDALPDDAALAELDLPDPDTLQAGDDFSAFMRRAVPERLRRRALRRLWGSNPVLACVDGLNDYDDDYTIPAVCGADMKTAYKVGRGFAARVIGPPAATPADGPDLPEAAESAAAAEIPQTGAAAAVQDAAARPAEDAPGPARRRMRFAFDDATGEPTS